MRYAMTVRTATALLVLTALATWWFLKRKSWL